GTAAVAGDAKAPASRTQSKRFAELGDIWHVAPAFGMRGACSRFLEGQPWSRAMPKRRQAGRSPNVPRNSETCGTSRQRLGGTAAVAGDAKAPASRTQSKRFAELGDIWHVAPAFGVRGACSRFWEGHQWSRAVPKRRQAGRSPNASRNSETLGTSRQRLECAELAPAFGRDSGGRGRGKASGRPDECQ